MRLLRTFTALTFAICTLGAQAAQAADRPGAQTASRHGEAPPALTLLQAPQMPIGALVFAAVGAVFLFRGRRVRRMPERD